jgi:hypothetical protein
VNDFYLDSIETNHQRTAYTIMDLAGYIGGIQQFFYVLIWIIMAQTNKWRSMLHILE